MPLNQDRIVALRRDMLRAESELESDQGKLWDVTVLAAACNFDYKNGAPHATQTPVYLSNSAWEYFRNCVAGFNASEVDLAANLIDEFDAGIREIERQTAANKPSKRKAYVHALKNLQKDLNLDVFDFDVFTVFYRVRSNRIEIIQLVDAVVDAIHPLDPKQTIGGQKEKIPVYIKKLKQQENQKIDWFHLKPLTIFAALVLGIIGISGIAWMLQTYLAPVNVRLRYASAPGSFLALIGFLGAYETLKRNSVSNYVLGAVLTFTGFFVSLVLAFKAISNPWIPVLIGTPYFTYTISRLFLAAKENRDRQNRVVVACLVLMNVVFAGLVAFAVYMRGV